jgi:diacylglycerol kinase family enzyme
LSKNYPEVNFLDCSLLSDDLDFNIAKYKSETCLFVACGGDGTVVAVAERIYQIPSFCLTVIPFGTGNDFSRAIGIFKEVSHLERLANIFAGRGGEVIDFDMWTINGRLFINYLTIGYDAAAVNLFQNLRHKLPKFLQRPFFNRVLYLISGVFHLFYSIPLGAMLQYGDKEIKISGCKSIVMGNINSYAGGKPLHSKVVFNDQSLNVFKVKGIWVELQLILGRGAGEAIVIDDSFILTLEKKVSCQVDGEPFEIAKGKHTIKYLGKLRVLGV